MTALLLGDVSLSAATGGRPLSADRPLALLVHGAGMDRSVWSLQTRWLAHHGVSAAAIDLPGHGASTDPARTSIGDYADWLAEIAVAAARPMHVVGHSMGTFIAIEAARRTALASLTLIGTAASMPVHPALLDAASANDPLAAQLMSGWAFAATSRTGPHPSPGGSMVGGTQAMIGQAAPGVLFDDLTMCADYTDAVATAATLSLPVTFVLGQADRMTPVANAVAVTDAVADARVEIVPHVGHMVMIEAPAVTRQLIADTVTAATANQ